MIPYGKLRLKRNTKMRILILEDDRERSKWFMKTFVADDLTFTKRVPQALSCLRGSSYDLIFLDRDLGQPKENGEDVSWVMKQEKLATDATIVIHSVNTYGQRNMERHIKSYNPNVEVIPFPKLMKLNREDFKLVGS